MARGTRLVGAGLYHHVFNRGNDRHPIFKQEQDYRRYIRYLQIFSQKHKIRIIAYALMEWHMHLFLYDASAKISAFMHTLHGKYAYLYNVRYERTGHVFGDRFKNKIVDTNTYGKWLSRYIHRQAVDAGIVDSAENYQWTSYHHYIGLGGAREPFLYSTIILEQFGDTIQDQVNAYRSFIEKGEEGPIDWKQTEMNANPIIGNRAFVERVSKQVGCENFGSCDVSEIIENICIRNGLSLDVIRHPSGYAEKQARRFIMKTLNHGHGVSVSVIAKELQVSKGLVSMTLKH